MSNFDVVVVGGGTAGCVVAARATRSGLRTLVIEAGPDYGPRAAGRWPAGLLDPFRIPDTHDWGLRSYPTAGRAISHPTARVLGGCSAHNHCSVVWGSRAFYDRWAELAGRAWSAAEMESWLERADATLRTVGPEALGTLGSTFLEACAGHFDLEPVDAAGFCRPSLGAFRTNIDAGERFNTAFAHLDAARTSSQLTIWPDTTATRLVVRDGAATHVDVRRGAETSTVSAGLAVLCAGAYQTPALLWRSGIGPAERLERLGIAPIADLGMVGMGLQDHPAVSLRFEATPRFAAALKAEAHRGLSPWQTYAKVRTSRCASTASYDLQIYPYFYPGPDGRPTLHFPVACMTPQSTGTVVIDGADGPPLIDHAFLSDASGHDLAVLAEGVELVRALIAEGPLAAFVGPELDGGPSGSGQDLETWIRGNTAHYYHPAATCRMGTDPGTSVVDARGRVHGIEGLIVADASVFPGVPDANTNLPVVATASRLAEEVASEGENRRGSTTGRV
jgi:choline dehydrogenase